MSNLSNGSSSTSFYKRKDDQIYFSFHFDNNRLLISTKNKVPLKFWDNERKRAKESVNFKDGRGINIHLNTIELRAKEVFAEFIRTNQRKPTVAELRALFNIAFFSNAKYKKVLKTSLFEALIIEYCKKLKAESKQQSVRLFKNTEELYLEFCHFKKIPTNIELFTYSLRNEFVSYMKNEKQYKPNTQSNHLKRIVSLINYAVENGIINKYPINTKKVNINVPKTTKLALTFEQIGILENAVLKTDSQNRIRDLFLIGIYTGQRYSDYSRISKSMLVNGFIKIDAQIKTGATVEIPLHNKLDDLLKKYDYEAPCYEINYFNRAIRKVFLSIPELSHLAKDVTSHTARHTFSTLLISKNVNTSITTDITGHKSLQSFQTYVHKTDDSRATALRELNNVFDVKPTLRVV